MDNGNGHNDFNAFTGEITYGAEQANIASELIGQNPDIRKLFASLSYIKDEEEAADFAKCIAKCLEDEGLPDELRIFELILNTRAAIKGGRARLIADVLTQVRTEVGEDATKEERRRMKEVQSAHRR